MHWRLEWRLNFNFRLQELKTRLLNAEDFGDETFLSEDIAINIIQEFKNAFIRCSMVICNFIFNGVLVDLIALQKSWEDRIDQRPIWYAD